MPDKIKESYESIKNTDLFLDENHFREQLNKDPKGVFNLFNEDKNTNGLFLDYNDFEDVLGLKKKSGWQTSSPRYGDGTNFSVTPSPLLQSKEPTSTSQSVSGVKFKPNFTPPTIKGEGSTDVAGIKDIAQEYDVIQQRHNYRNDITNGVLSLYSKDPSLFEYDKDTPTNYGTETIPAGTPDINKISLLADEYIKKYEEKNGVKISDYDRKYILHALNTGVKQSKLAPKIQALAEISQVKGGDVPITQLDEVYGKKITSVINEEDSKLKAFNEKPPKHIQDEFQPEINDLNVNFTTSVEQLKKDTEVVATEEINKIKQHYDELVNSGQLDPQQANDLFHKESEGVINDLNSKAMNHYSEMEKGRNDALKTIQARYNSRVKHEFDLMKQNAQKRIEAVKAEFPQVSEKYFKRYEQHYTTAAKEINNQEAQIKLQEFKNLPPLQGIEKAMRAGWGDVMSSIGGSMGYSGLNSSYIDEVVIGSQNVNALPQEGLQGGTTIEHLTDPDWWVVNGVRSAPFMIAMLPTGVIGGGLAGSLATAFNATKRAAQISSVLGGGISSWEIEKSMEAGSGWQQAIEEGKDVGQANEIASNIAKYNIATLPVNVLQMMPIFGSGFKFLKNLEHPLFETIWGGGEEVLQGWAQAKANAQAEGKDVSLFDYAMSPQAIEEGAIGTAMSGGMIAVSLNHTSDIDKQIAGIMSNLGVGGEMQARKMLSILNQNGLISDAELSEHNKLIDYTLQGISQVENIPVDPSVKTALVNRFVAIAKAKTMDNGDENDLTTQASRELVAEKEKEIKEIIKGSGAVYLAYIQGSQIPIVTTKEGVQSIMSNEKQLGNIDIEIHNDDETKSKYDEAKQKLVDKKEQESRKVGAEQENQVQTPPPPPSDGVNEGVNEGVNAPAQQEGEGGEIKPEGINEGINTQENDNTKNEQGLPSEVREGQEPIETKPIESTSQEATSTSGSNKKYEKEEEITPPQNEGEGVKASDKLRNFAKEIRDSAEGQVYSAPFGITPQNFAKFLEIVADAIDATSNSLSNAKAAITKGFQFLNSDEGGGHKLKMSEEREITNDILDRLGINKIEERPVWKSISNELKAWKKGIKEGTINSKVFGTKVADIIKQKLKDSKIKPNQLKSLLARVAAVRTEKALDRIISYIDKVSTINNYNEKIQKANDLRSELKKKANRELNKFGNLIGDIKNVLTLNPALIEYENVLDTYNDLLEKLLENKVPDVSSFKRSYREISTHLKPIVDKLISDEYTPATFEENEQEQEKLIDEYKTAYDKLLELDIAENGISEFIKYKRLLKSIESKIGDLIEIDPKKKELYETTLNHVNQFFQDKMKTQLEEHRKNLLDEINNLHSLAVESAKQEFWTKEQKEAIDEFLKVTRDTEFKRFDTDELEMYNSIQNGLIDGFINKDLHDFMIDYHANKQSADIITKYANVWDNIKKFVSGEFNLDKILEKMKTEYPATASYKLFKLGDAWDAFYDKGLFPIMAKFDQYIKHKDSALTKLNNALHKISEKHDFMIGIIGTMLNEQSKMDEDMKQNHIRTLEQNVLENKIKEAELKYQKDNNLESLTEQEKSDIRKDISLTDEEKQQIAEEATNWYYNTTKYNHKASISNSKKSLEDKEVSAFNEAYSDLENAGVIQKDGTIDFDKAMAYLQTIKVKNGIKVETLKNGRIKDVELNTLKDIYDICFEVLGELPDLHSSNAEKLGANPELQGFYYPAFSRIEKEGLYADEMGSVSNIANILHGSFTNPSKISTKSGSTNERVNNMIFRDVRPSRQIPKALNETLRQYYLRDTYITVRKAFDKAIKKLPYSQRNSKTYLKFAAKAIDMVLVHKFSMATTNKYIKALNTIQGNIAKGYLSSIKRPPAEIGSNAIRYLFATGFSKRSIKVIKDIVIQKEADSRFKTLIDKYSSMELHSSKYALENIEAKNTALARQADWLIRVGDSPFLSRIWIAEFNKAYKKETGKDFNVNEYNDKNSNYAFDNKMEIERAASRAEKSTSKVIGNKNPLANATHSNLLGVFPMNKKAIENKLIFFLQEYPLWESNVARVGLQKSFDTNLPKSERLQGVKDFASIAMANMAYSAISYALIQGLGMLVNYIGDDDEDKKDFERYKANLEEMASLSYLSSLSGGGLATTLLMPYMPVLKQVFGLGMGFYANLMYDNVEDKEAKRKFIKNTSQNYNITQFKPYITQQDILTSLHGAEIATYVYDAASTLYDRASENLDKGKDILDGFTKEDKAFWDMALVVTIGSALSGKNFMGMSDLLSGLKRTLSDVSQNIQFEKSLNDGHYDKNPQVKKYREDVLKMYPNTTAKDLDNYIVYKESDSDSAQTNKTIEVGLIKPKYIPIFDSAYVKAYKQVKDSLSQADVQDNLFTKKANIDSYIKTEAKKIALDEYYDKLKKDYNINTDSGRYSTIKLENSLLKIQKK